MTPHGAETANNHDNNDGNMVQAMESFLLAFGGQDLDGLCEFNMHYLHENPLMQGQFPLHQAIQGGSPMAPAPAPAPAPAADTPAAHHPPVSIINAPSKADAEPASANNNALQLAVRAPPREAEEDVDDFVVRLEAEDEDIVDNGMFCAFEGVPGAGKDDAAKNNVKSRPNGSYKLWIPPELASCYCKCGSRNVRSNAPNIMASAGGLVAFLLPGWLHHDELVVLDLPIGTPVLGIIKVDAFGTSDDAHTVHILDVGSQELFCCTTMWVYATYLEMYSRGLIVDTDTMVTQIRDQIRLKTPCLRWIRSLRMNVNLHQLAIVLRHCLGVHAKSQKKSKSNRVHISPAHLSEVSFYTCDQVTALFANSGACTWPADKLWQKGSVARIHTLEGEVRALRMALMRITESIQPSMVADAVSDQTGHNRFATSDDVVNSVIARVNASLATPAIEYRTVKHDQE
jgi:hypothetical protein